jgi:CheY-like chemotaxis protein
MASKPQVLVVDDEVYLREIIALDLETAGYDVLQAGSGSEGIAVVKSKPVDLIVSDVRMPSGNGLQLLEQVRALDPGRPSFVLITAYADVSSDEALHLGAEGFLRKPIERDELLEVVSQALIPRETRWQCDPKDFEGARLIQDLDGDLLGEDPSQIMRITFGQGGMFLETKDDQPACYEIVQFDLACSALAGGRLAGYGRVRWTRRESRAGLPAGIGVEFLSLSDSSRRDVIAHLATHKPRAFVPLRGVN